MSWWNVNEFGLVACYSEEVKQIVGLGNPGEKYENTRHNVGFRVVEALASQEFPTFRFQAAKKFECELLKAGDVLLAKPQTFMNESGVAVKKLISYYQLAIDDLYVVCDDLDIELSRFKIQKGKGPRQHNGLESIYKCLGTKSFWHVRIGIEHRREGGGQRVSGEPSVAKAMEGKEYVLQEFQPEELKVINKVVEEVVERLLRELRLGGVD